MVAGESSSPNESTSVEYSSTPAGGSLHRVALWQLAADLGSEHQRVVEPRLRRIERIVARLVERRGLAYRHLDRLVELLVKLASEQREHEERESRQVYPAIREILCDDPIGAGMAAYFLHRSLELEDSHQAMSGVLDEMRRLTGDYHIPTDACADYHALMDMLSALDANLRRHWQQEERILFPQVLDAARSCAGYPGDRTC